MNHGEWLTLEAFGMWLKAVEIFLVISVLIVAYWLVWDLVEEDEEGK